MFQHDLMMAQDDGPRRVRVTSGYRVVDGLVKIQQNGGSGASQPRWLGLGADPVFVLPG
jgi:hypothetical protein